VDRRRFATELATVGAIAAALRAAYAVAMVSAYGDGQVSDFLYMQQLAESLAAGRGFTIDGVRIYSQSVGYPAALAALYSLLGPRLSFAFAFNVLLGAVSVMLVYALADRLFGSTSPLGRTPARMAAAIAAIYPDSLLFVPVIAAENLVVPLLLGATLLLLRPLARPWHTGLAVGLLAAGAASAKAYVLFFFLLVPLFWWRDRQPFVRLGAAAALAGVIALAPWTAITWRDSGGELVPFAAIAGEVFLDCTNPASSGGPTNQFKLPEEVTAGKSQMEINRLQLEKGLGYAKADPAWYARLVLLKVARSFSPVRDWLFQHLDQQRFFTPFLSRWGTTAFNAALLALVGAGLWLARAERRALMLGAIALGSSLIFQAAFCAYSRYRYPYLCVLLPHAGLALATLTARVRALRAA
jgi:hypothetical protein